MRHALLIVLALPLLAGCTAVENSMAWLENQTQSTIDGFSYRKANDAPMIVPVSGPVAIDIESIGGDIDIEVNDELPHAVIEFTRVAMHGFGRKDEAIESLDAIETSVELRTGDLGQILAIRTGTVHDEDHFQSVRMKIKVPEVDGVRVRNRNGRVYATDVYGEIDIRTDDGDVRVMTNRAMLRPVTIVNDAGSIDYRVREESAGAIDAECVRGRVFHVVEGGRWVVEAGTDHNTLVASFNDGTNPIMLRAADGNIRVAVVPGPTLVGRMIID